MLCFGNWVVSKRCIVVVVVVTISNFFFQSKFSVLVRHLLVVTVSVKRCLLFKRYDQSNKKASRSQVWTCVVSRGVILCRESNGVSLLWSGGQ